MSLDKYHLAREEKDHFVIQHDDGSHFKVAKSKLDDETINKIRSLPILKMAGGGEVPDFLGGARETPTTPNPLMGAISDATDDAGDWLGRWTGAVGNQISALPEVASHALLNPDSALPDSVTQGADPIPPQAPPTGKALASNGPGGVPVVADTGSPVENSIAAPKAQAQSASAPTDYFKQLEDAQKTAQRGALDAGAAQQKQGEETAKALDDYAASLQKRQEDFQNRLDSYNAQTESAYNDYMNGEIDPNHMWHNMGTGNKVLAAISIALGGLGGGLSGRGGNTGLDVINQAINRDIEAQKANLDKKRSLLSMNFEKTRNLAEAESLTRSMMAAGIAAQTQKLAARYGGQVAAANAQSIVGQLKQQAIGQNYQMAVMGAKMAPFTGNNSQGFSMNPFIASDKELSARAVPTGTMNGSPTYHMAADEGSAKKLRETVEPDSQTVLQNILEMKRLANLGSAMSPTDRKRFQNLAQESAPLLGTLGGVNRFNLDEANMNKGMLGNMGTGLITDSTPAALDQVADYVRRARENAREHLLLNYRSPYQPKSATEHVAKR